MELEFEIVVHNRHHPSILFIYPYYLALRVAGGAGTYPSDLSLQFIAGPMQRQTRLLGEAEQLSSTVQSVWDRKSGAERK